jgi:hypothetical protein
MTFCMSMKLVCQFNDRVQINDFWEPGAEDNIWA